MLTIELNMYHAVALGAFLFWMGGIITDKVRLLNRYCIPRSAGRRAVLFCSQLYSTLPALPLSPLTAHCKPSS